MDRKLIVFALSLFSIVADGASYFVATNGNNSADGSSGTPWLTIQKAASTAVAGDTVTVNAGEYNEFVTFANSGTAANPIIFQGVKSGTNWQTIVDPSTAFTNGWVAAPEIGTGVYKQTNMTFTPWEASIDHKRLAFVYDMGDISGAIANAYSGSGLTTGSNILTLASSATLTSAIDGRTITFWDSVGAIFGNISTAGVSTNCYLRLRDGSDPNGLNIRLAPNKTAWTTDVIKPAFTIDDRHYLVISNFWIRGAFIQIRGLNANCYSNIIGGNYLSGGFCRIELGSSAQKNVIATNSMTTDYYGYSDPGAWDNSPHTTGYNNRANLYLVSKFLMGQSASYDYCVYLNLAGDSNVVSFNHIYKSLGTGIDIVGNPPSGVTTGSQFYGNTVEGHTSVGIHDTYGNTQTSIFDNLISDCDVNMRFHAMNYSSEVDRVVYVFRNRVWLPADAGDQIYTHFFSNASTYYPQFWVYNNSFSGGLRGLSVGISVANYGIQNISGCRFINNILNAPQAWIGNIGIGFFTDAGMVGAFDYSEINPPALTYPTSSDPAWWGAHNVKALSDEWSTNSVPTFLLSNGSPAIGAGVNMLSTYPLLPQDSSVIPGAWDIGALQTPTITVNCSDISGTNGVSIASSTVTSSGGTSPYTYVASGLPTGLSCSSGGTISGTPTQTGTFPFTVISTDANSYTGTNTCTATIDASPGTATAVNATVLHIQGTP